jgi:ribose transport system permease protein
MSDVKLNRFAASARSALSRSDVFGGTALAALVIIAAVIALLEPQFFTPSNLLNIGRQASVLVIVACGMTMVILSGAIDLSVGSAIALCSVVGASLATNVGLNAPLTIAIMIGLGAVIGSVKGGSSPGAGSTRSS